jgi:hypothetical protein
MKERDRSSQKLGSIKVGGKTLSLASLFEVDEVDLDKEYREQSALYAYFVVEAAKAEREHASAVDEKDFVHAECDEFYREEIRDTGVKLTEAMVESAIIQDDEYREVRIQLLRAKEHWTILKGIVRALEQRANMLISLGAHRRAEFDMTNMVIKKSDYDASVEDVKTSLKNRRRKR